MNSDVVRGLVQQANLLIKIACYQGVDNFKRRQDSQHQRNKKAKVQGNGLGHH